MSALDKLYRRVQMMISRAVVRLVDPATLMQQLQVERLPGEVLDRVEHFEGYGRTAHAPDGAEAIVLGRRGRLVALSVAHRQFRVRNLAAGEQALYDDLGNVILFKRDRILINAVDHVEVIAPSCHIQAITTHDGNVTINGNLVVSGTINADGNITSAAEIADATGTMGAMRDVHNIHDHDVPTAPGTSDVPNQQM
jgi:phage baseplate assembly protein V